MGSKPQWGSSHLPARMVGVKTALTPAQRARQQVRHADGRYGETVRTDPGAILAGTFGADRLTQLAADGYTPPVAYNPRATNADQWWAEHFAAAEYNPDGDIPKMPDHSSDTRTGHSLTGTRRLPLVNYPWRGATFQMPSATACRRFAETSNSHAVDIPITVTRPDGTQYAGWVRASGRGHSWMCEPLNIEGKDGAAAAEAVAALLEARRPSLALREAGDLIARHNHNRAGIEATPVSSSWIRAIGYGPDNTLVMQTETGRVYSYRMAATYLRAVQKHRSPGEAFNHIVKKKGQRVEAEQCPDCLRIYLTGNTHVCPPQDADRTSDTTTSLAKNLFR